MCDLQPTAAPGKKPVLVVGCLFSGGADQPLLLQGNGFGQTGRTNRLPTPPIGGAAEAQSVALHLEKEEIKMGNDKKWIGWNKPVTILSLMAITALIVGAYFWLVGKGPEPVFEFDDGTTQGWTANGIFDDAGKTYDGSLYKVAHGEQHQYPNKFPCTAADPSKCDPLKDKKGSLLLSIAGLQPSLPQFNFPTNSNYWQIDIVSPTLSKLFQNKSEFEAYVGDMFGIDPDHVRAAMLLNVDVGGSIKQVMPIGGVTEQVVSKDAWTKLSAKFTVPAGGYIRNIVIRIRGDWKTYNLYEGGIFVDHVAAVK